jgi:hypothetical protein
MEKAKYHHYLILIFILLLTTAIGFMLKEEFLVDLATYLICFLVFNIFRELYVLISIINSSSITLKLLPNGKRAYLVENDKSGTNIEALPTVFKCFIKSYPGNVANEFILMHEYGHFKNRHIILQMALLSIFMSYLVGILQRGGLHHFILYWVFTYILLKKMFKSEEDQADIYALGYVKDIQKIESAFNLFEDKGGGVLKKKFNPKTLWKYTIPNQGFKRVFLYVTWLFSIYLRHILNFAASIYVFEPLTRVNGGFIPSRFILALLVFLAPQIFQLFYRVFNINTTYYSITGTVGNNRSGSLRTSSYRNSRERLDDLYKLLNKNLNQDKKSKFDFFSHFVKILPKFGYIMIVYLFISAGTFVNLPYFGYGFEYHQAAFEISTNTMKMQPKVLYNELEKISSDSSYDSSTLFEQFKQSYETAYKYDYEIDHSFERLWKSVEYIFLITPPPHFVTEFYNDIISHFVRVTNRQKKTLYYLHCKRPQTHRNVIEDTTAWVVSIAAATHKMIKTGNHVDIEEVKALNYFSFLPVLWNEYLRTISIILIILAIAIHVTIKLKSRIK